MLAQRCKLAEVGRPFDRAALESQLLRCRIVVNRGVRVVDLRIEHLMRPAPWPDERSGGLRDDRFERFKSHRTPRNVRLLHERGVITFTGRYPISSGRIAPRQVMLPETAGHREAVAAFRKKRHPTIEINDREATPQKSTQATFRDALPSVPRKPMSRSRIRRSASTIMRSISSLTVGMSWMRPTTMPQLQAPASMFPSIMTLG